MVSNSNGRGKFDSVVLQLKWYNQFQFAGYYAAKEKGFYKEEGLDVIIREGTPDNRTISNVLTGKANFGVGDADVLYSRLKGNPLVVLSVIFQHSPYVLLVNNKGNITEPSDLIGKKVMISEEQGTANIKSIFLVEGIPLDSIHFVPQSWNLNDLTSGKVDAISAYITSEYVQLKKMGYKPKVFFPEDYGVDFYGDLLFTTEQEIKTNPERVEAFRRASIKGWTYAMNHVDEMIEIILSMKGTKEHGITRELLREEAARIRKLILPEMIEIGHFSIDRFEKIAEVFKSLGMIKGNYTLDGFVYAPEKESSKEWQQIILITIIISFFIVCFTVLWILQLKRVVNKRTIELKKEIEQHKITEVSLYHERELLQSLMDNIPDTIYFKDNKSRFIKINKAQAETLGLANPDDAILKTDFDFFPKEQASLAFEDEKELIKNRKPMLDKVEKIRVSDGTYRYVSATKVPILNKKGLVTGLVGISRDISSRRNVEESLRESETKYRSLFENIINAFAYFKVLFDENKQPVDLIFVEVNKIYENITGLKRENIISLSISKFMPISNIDLLGIYKKLAESGGSTSFEYYSNIMRKWIFLTVYSDREGFCSTLFEDITERKTAEEQILNSERKFRTLFDNSSDAIVLISEFKYLDCNAQAYEMYGCSREQLIGKSPIDFSPEFQLNGGSSQEQALEKMTAALNDQMQHFEWIHCKLNGDLFFVEVNLNKIEINDKILLQGIVRDISERKRAEESLKQRQLEFRSLADNLPDFVARYDRHLRYIYLNKQMEFFTGIPKEEMLGKSVLDLGMHDNSFLLSKHEIDRVFSSGNINTYEFTSVVSGKPCLFESRLIPEFGVDNTVKTVLAITRDITEKKRFEEVQNALYKISESVNAAENLPTLYKSIHDTIKELMIADNFYIAIYDPQNDLVSFPYFVDEYDTTPDPVKPRRGLTEFVLRTGKEILVNDKVDLELRALGEVELIGEPTKIWMGIPLKLREKTFGVLVIQDYHDENAYGEEEIQILTYVSEQIAIAIDKKRSEEELVRYADELKELNASKDKFFSIISHDLRSPFHALLGITELIADDGMSMEKGEIINFNKEIHKALKNQYRLLENLLEWSRIQTGKLEYQPVKVNLFEKVNDVINVLMGNAVKKEISLINNVSNDVILKADQNMIQSILQNLISNAIKFTNIKGEININAVERPGFAEISIADNGIGIDSKDLNFLFRIDVQYSRLGTAKEKGTGLGLGLCKELVEKHGGKIWAESKLGSGTTFTFTVPLFNLS